MRNFSTFSTLLSTLLTLQTYLDIGFLTPDRFKVFAVLAEFFKCCTDGLLLTGVRYLLEVWLGLRDLRDFTDLWRGLADFWVLSR